MTSHPGTVTRTGGTLRLDDGAELHVDDVRSIGAEYATYEGREPDPGWWELDGEGHEHRWYRPLSDAAAAPVLPTAERTMRHVDCDGACGDWDCGGYDVPVWHCYRCGDEVTPGYRPCTGRYKIREGYYEVEVVGGDSPGPITSISDAPGSLTWPSAPGSILFVSGRVWETAGEIVSTGTARGTTIRRSLVLQPDPPEVRV